MTVLGEDYVSLYHRNMSSWGKGRATKKAKETDLCVDWLIGKILAGDITKSIIMLTDEYYAIYGQHKRKNQRGIRYSWRTKKLSNNCRTRRWKIQKDCYFRKC